MRISLVSPPSLSHALQFIPYLHPPHRFAHYVEMHLLGKPRQSHRKGNQQTIVLHTYVIELIEWVLVVCICVDSCIGLDSIMFSCRNTPLVMSEFKFQTLENELVVKGGGWYHYLTDNNSKNNTPL